MTSVFPACIPKAHLAVQVLRMARKQTVQVDYAVELIISIPQVLKYLWYLHLVSAPSFGMCLCMWISIEESLTSQYSDTNYALVGALMDAVPVLTNTEEENFLFSIFTGDLVAHDPDNEQSRDYVLYSEVRCFFKFLIADHKLITWANRPLFMIF